jgi:hypothetical protein
MPDLLLGGIAINEVLIDPNGANNFDTDGNGTARGGDEFLELINTSSTAIDISGLELWDQGRDNWFTFPPGTILEPGAVAVVVRNVQNGGSLPAVTGDNLAFDADFSGNVFNNNGDNLVVYDPANDEYIQATYNGDAVVDPTVGPGFDGFSTTATQSGSGEDFGNDQDGISIQRDPNGFVNDQTPTPGTDLVCFASGTLLETDRGFRRIDTLRAGDLLNTSDAGLQPIRWIFARRLDAAELAANPKLHPIVVDTTEINGIASQLRVSRHHRIMVTGKIAKRMFGRDQVLVPAKDLLGFDGVSTDQSCKPFFYFHVLMDSHHILNANGIAAESLLLGQEAISAMSKDALRELEILFPKDAPTLAMPIRTPSRHIVSGARARKMVVRHSKNEKALDARF